MRSKANQNLARRAARLVILRAEEWLGAVKQHGANTAGAGWALDRLQAALELRKKILNDEDLASQLSKLESYDAKRGGR